MTTDYAALAGEVRALSDLPAGDRIVSAPLANVLLWGLSGGHADPILGVLRTVRLDMELLIECVHVNSDTMEAGLVTTARRLDVAIELLRRLHRADEAAR
jgi:hypothetical protein